MITLSLNFPNLNTVTVKHQLLFQLIHLGLHALCILNNQLVRLPVPVHKIGDIFCFPLDDSAGDFVPLCRDQAE